MTSLSRRGFLAAAAGAGAEVGLVGCDPSSSPPSPPPPAAVHRDVAYAPPVGRGHLMDVYMPAGAGPFPVVVYQAGSAWMSDDTKGSTATDLAGLTTASGLARRWTPHGIAVVGLNVRSSGQARFPAQLEDVEAAIDRLRAHAAQFRLDPDRFATMGTSSGAWVALMGGLRRHVRAIVDLFGPTDFRTMDDQRIRTGMRHDPADSPESRLMGFPVQSDAAAVARASPLTYVRAGSPPVLICHGTSDPLVPYRQSVQLFDAYERAGATATLALVRGAGHTDDYLAAADRSPRRRVRHTEAGRTTSGTDPAPTYDSILAFLRAGFR